MNIERLNDAEQRALRELLAEWDLPESAAQSVADTYAFAMRRFRLAWLDLGHALSEGWPRPVQRLIDRMRGTGP